MKLVHAYHILNETPPHTRGLCPYSILEAENDYKLQPSQAHRTYTRYYPNLKFANLDKIFMCKLSTVIMVRVSTRF